MSENGIWTVSDNGNVCRDKTNSVIVKHTYDEAVELAGNGRYNIGLLVLCSIISNAVALDMFGFALVVTTSACDLELTMTQKGILTSIPFSGLLFAYVWGYVGDTRGRKFALLWSLSIGFVFSALTSLSGTWPVMVILKFIDSSFTMASLTLTITWLGECTGQKRRGQYLLIMNSINLASEAVSFFLAYFILQLEFSYFIPWLNITYRPWRLLTLVMSIPLALGAILLVYFHESPKFLANSGNTDKALVVLEDMFKRNGGKKGEYQVKSLKTEDTPSKLSMCQNLWMHTVPIFKPPLLWRTLQLFYITTVMCSTASVFVMWFPTMINSFYHSLTAGNDEELYFCDRILYKDSSNYTLDNVQTNSTCIDKISDNTIWAGASYGLFFTSVNLLISRLASWRRLLVLAILLVSAVSGLMINLITQPIVSIISFVLLQIPSVGIGISASYFVDLYSTSYRGMMACLAMMVARGGALAGTNIVAAFIENHCSLTFYAWSGFVLSGVLVSIFLPPDRKKKDTADDSK